MRGRGDGSDAAQVFDFCIEPLLWRGCLGLARKYVGQTSRKDGSPLVGPPTVFLAAPWSTPFQAVLDHIKAGALL